jgi:hypothetical protein
MTAQRKFRPSQASFWGNCAAFHRFTENIPDGPGTDAAREGTCAAWVAEVMLNGGTVAEGDAHANGWIVTDYMLNDVSEYVELVRSLGGSVTAEKFVTASENPLIAGTMDSSVSVRAARTLHTIDLKYGRGVVEHVGNKQTVPYAWGDFITYPPGTFDVIKLSIYQPRAFHRDGTFRTWTLTPEQLHAEFTKLWSMAVEGEKPDSLATPGEHCRYCPAATRCVALIDTAHHRAEIIQSRDMREMTAKELANELDFILESEKIIKAHSDAIKAEAEARGRTENIPGWGFEQTYGNRVFSESGTTVHLFTGVDPWKPSLVTPAELERRGADKERVKKITKRAATGMKLVRSNIEQLFNKEPTK